MQVAFGANVHAWLSIPKVRARAVQPPVRGAGVLSAAFDHLVCNHSEHEDRAVGVDGRGKSKAAKTATYPIRYNVALWRCRE